MGEDLDNTYIILKNAGASVETRDYHGGLLCRVVGSAPNPTEFRCRRHHAAVSIDSTSPAASPGVVKNAAGDADPVAYLNANGASALGSWVTSQGATFRDDEFIPAIQAWA